MARTAPPAMTPINFNFDNDVGAAGAQRARLVTGLVIEAGGGAALVAAGDFAGLARRTGRAADGAGATGFAGATGDAVASPGLSSAFMSLILLQIHSSKKRKVRFGEFTMHWRGGAIKSQNTLTHESFGLHNQSTDRARRACAKF